jgi:transcription antitermination protein NusB
MSRRMARETALQALYEMDFHPGEEQQIVHQHGAEVPAEDAAFYQRMIAGVRAQQATIDPVIQRFLKEGWTLARISSVDRAILRIAVYELLFAKETPQAAIVNEAIELAKTFSSEESSRFINGVLGEMLRQWDGIEGKLE